MTSKIPSLKSNFPLFANRRQIMLAVEPQVIIQNIPLPAPDLHTQDMVWFLGKWAIYSKSLTDHDKNIWQEETLSAEHTLEMGGHLIFEHFFGPLNGEPYEA